MERIAFGGWPNCYRLSNELIELIATTDVGPRVIHFGLAGGENVFHVVEDDAGLTGGNSWRLYGGHRLWHAPETMPRTYCPDNDPVEIEESGGTVTLTQPTEKTTGVQKQIALRLAPGAASVTVTHHLTNHNLWAVELAPWALSVMAPGGMGVIPLPPRGSHEDFLLPTASIVTWAYTDMADPRWTWGKQYVLLRQDATAAVEQKIGLTATQGWMAYVRAGVMFAKTFAAVPDAPYPDLGSVAEMFTNADLLEVETLGPLQTIEPGGSAEHVEVWHLADGVPAPQSEADVEAYLVPHIRGLALP